MVSTFTTLLGLEKQGTGDHSGSWGTFLNANFDVIDRNNARLPLSVAGSADVTLSATQAQYRSIEFTGVLTGNINVVFPVSSTQGWQLKNSTTGNFTLTAKLSGGTGQLIAQGENAEVEGDGTNMVSRRVLTQNLQEIHGTTGGSANAHTLTLSPAITAYKKGQIFTAIAGFSNSGATTLAVSGLSAQTVQLNGAACAGNEIVVNKPFTVMYDGSNFQLIYSPSFANAASVQIGSANIFTASNTFSLVVAGNNIVLTTTDAGAVGSTLRLYHNTATPANSDVTGIITFDGKDSSAADQTWADIRVQITDVTAGTEDANLLIRTVVAGTLATRATWGAGLQVGAPTGGDVANAVNAQGLRVNNDPVSTLAAANAFTAANTFSLAVAGTNLTLTTTDAGATGSTLAIDHNTATPANNDVPGIIAFTGKDSAANAQTWANIKAFITDVISGTEDAEIRFETAVAGTVAGRVRIGAGLYTDGATGGDKGANSINASQLYKDGTALPSNSGVVAGTTASPGATDNGTIYVANGAGFTLTLPALSGVSNGYRVGLQNNTTSGTCLANRSSSDTIISAGTTGLTSVTLPSLGDMVWFIADVTNSRWVLHGMRSFTSANQTITSNSSVAVAHSLGVQPTEITLWVKNTSGGTLNGYPANDEVMYLSGGGDRGGVSKGADVQSDATNINVAFNLTAAALSLIPKGGGLNVALTNASWAIIVRARVDN